jgi:hypothetical protein
MIQKTKGDEEPMGLKVKQRQQLLLFLDKYFQVLY